MAAPTNYYVDPSIAANSGAGTIGDPYGDLQYALDSVTRDATNGDQFNIKAGTDEILAAGLDLTTYGTPAETAPLVLRGYTATANDGGIGGIDCNAGAYGLFAVLTHSSGALVDLHVHNGGGVAYLIQVGADWLIDNVEVDNNTGGGINVSAYSSVQRCNVHNIGAIGVLCATSGHIAANYCANGTNTFTYALYLSDNGGVALRNIISIDGASSGIYLKDFGATARHNSILSNGGTGSGIVFNDRFPLAAINNLIEGFSGVGGRGINYQTAGGNPVGLTGYNACYNNTTNYDLPADVVLSLGDDETLASSPFDKSGSDTFANRFTYFAPANVGNVRGGAYPSGIRLDKGAVQHTDPAGGGGGLLIHPGMSGGMRA